MVYKRVLGIPALTTTQKNVSRSKSIKNKKKSKSIRFLGCINTMIEKRNNLDKQFQ